MKGETDLCTMCVAAAAAEYEDFGDGLVSYVGDDECYGLFGAEMP